MTLVCSVMAWGSEIVVNDFATLKTQLSASGTADVVKLGQDIAYATNGSDLLNIERSLTLDGQGHIIKGYGKTNTHVSGSGQNHNSVIAVNANVFGAAPTLNVTIKNLKLGNVKDEYTTDGQQKAAVNARFYGIISFDGVAKLTIENDSLKTGVIYDSKTKKWVGPGNQQPLCFTGTNTTPLQLTINNSFVGAGNGAYPVYVLKPITANLTNVTTEGWCALYFKYRYNPSGAYTTYGDVAGTRGSVVTANNCAFNAPNIHEGETNGFAVFPIEDDGITLNLNNCSMNAERFTSQAQMVISLQYSSRPVNDEEMAPVIVNISGDNTHLYNVEESRFALSGWNTNDDNNPTTYTPAYKNAPLHMNITGGTFTVNPSNIKFRNYNNEGTEVVWEYAFIDPEIYEVKTISQGGVTVYRVVKRAARDGEDKLYDLNDNVQSQGDGQNPTTSFDLYTGEDMTLNQEITKAGYVEVKDNATAGATTVTVGTPTEDQTLVINNGLDVQGDSKVDVQAGSTLVIGEGGIVTSKPENIVIEADRAGAASLIMDPAITVNQTPNLTVRMTAKQIGKTADGEFWHRFAMPVQHADSWDKEGSLGTGNDKYPTYLYGWNYSSDSWYKLPGGVSDMQAFMGYTLRLATEETATDQLQDVVYIFKGQLAGNTNNTLQFSRNGYNFFGNSYTGYIDLKQLVAQITGDSKIEGTAWVWNTDLQRYQDVPLNLLAAGIYDGESDKWKTEIAPMQTFILKQNGSNNASTEINYASAVWGNPRYSAATGVAAAPARRVADMNTTRMYIAVTAANGQSDEVFFVEDANYSDAFDNGYDASKYMNPNTINVFANQNGIDLGTVASDNLNGKTLSLKTNGELAYTMSFKNVEGEEYAIRDNVTGAVINIEEGATYEFAAQPNSTIEGRFEIVAAAKLPTAIENTEVKANVKGIYTIMGQYLGENFDILPAGVYVVDGVKIVK